VRINGSGRAVQFTHGFSGRDGEVTYELVGGRSGIACRRVTELHGGGRVLVVLPIDTVGTLRLFLDADDEALSHRHLLREMLLQAAFFGVPNGPCERSESSRPADEGTKQFSNLEPDDELAVHAYLRTLAATAGMHGYIAFVGDLDDPLGPCLSLLVGCTPGWVQRYVQQRWYLSDPLLKRAVDSERPVVKRHMALLRGAVSTAIDAWVDVLKADAARRVELTDTQLAVLMRWRNGETAERSARAMVATESGINYHRRSIKSKLGATSLKDAYAMAADLGLLRG
jgi:DNA-binding CsgD family transcriptional regulator